MSAMRRESDEEWCLVGNDEATFVRLATGSFDEIESEPTPVKHEGDEVDDCRSMETVDVLTLLPDHTTFGRTTQLPRETMKMLLSKIPSKQRHASRATTAPQQYKRSIKIAFDGPHLYPERLRAQMPTRRVVPGDMPTYTPVEPLTDDKSTQANFIEDLGNSRSMRFISNTTIGRDDHLQAALMRSMTFSNQLKSKSQECERLWLQIRDLNEKVAGAEQQTLRDEAKLRRFERQKALSKQREQLTTQYQQHLKSELDELRHTTAQLQHQNDVMSGKEQNLHHLSLDDLEDLEVAMTKGITNLRAAIRAKYRQSLAQKREENLCVVCFAQPVSVVLLPCRHQVLCPGCALRVETCPIDRADIQDKVLTYGLNVYNSE